MKGFEPSTFCMASRRSSQLSYIRPGASRLVDYRPVVLASSSALLTSRSASAFSLATDVTNRHPPELPQPRHRLCVKRFEPLVLDLVLPTHLLHQQLGIGQDFQFLGARFLSDLEAGQKSPIFSHVVRAHANHTADCIDHPAVRVLKDGADRPRTRIPARASVHP